MSYLNLSQPHRISSIKRVAHKVLTNDDVLISSAIPTQAGLTVAELYNGPDRVPFGPQDKRMGTSDSHDPCDTCGLNYKNCIGHSGHIELTEAIYAFQFLKYVKGFASCFCFHCGKLIISKKNSKQITKILKNKTLQKRYAEVQKEIKKINDCPHCGLPVMKILVKKEQDSINLVAEPNKKAGNNDDEAKFSGRILQQNLSASFLMKQFSRLSNEDCFVMGVNPYLSHPKDMMILYQAVPPIQVRPSVKLDIKNIGMMDDGLTHFIADMIKHNEELKNKKGDGTLNRSILDQPDYQAMQQAGIRIYDSNVVAFAKTQPKNNGKEAKSIKARHKGKEGRFRGNISGKRTDQSSRSVITPDPQMSINHVGCPLMVARILSFPEYVMEQNYDTMVNLVRNGNTKYPGATKVESFEINEDGSMISRPFYIRKGSEMKINIGDIVHRNLVNGDPVIFNRQPSLHKLSMMCHFIRVIVGSTWFTFRLNVGVTEPYNADFDGDEMNMHAPQTLITATELVVLCDSGKRMITPKDSVVVIMQKQDAMTGFRMITGSDIMIDWKDAMDFMMETDKRLTGTIPKNSLVSGRYLFSQIIPKQVNILSKSESGKIDARIINGLMTHGQYNSSKSKTLTQQIWFTCGATETRNYLDNAQRGILNWLTKYGFTLGIKDLIMPSGVLDTITEIIISGLKAVENKITEYENNPYSMKMDVFERMLTQTLSVINSTYEELLQNTMKSGNGMDAMINSGSKGKMDNITQIIGCVGQADYEGGRIPRKYADNRILPYFSQHDDRGSARGYCVGSFFKGLGPAEFYCHTINGRIGIINTAVRTARTGYLQRRIVKLCEDIKVFYDRTVRNANEKIITLVYGGNGVSTEKQIQQKIDLIHYNNAQIREKLCYSKQELKEIDIDEESNEKFYKKVISLRDSLRAIQVKISLVKNVLIDKYMMPVDLQQRVIDIENQPHRDNKTIVEASYVIKQLKEMYSGKSFQVNVNSVEDDNINKMLLKIYLFDTLSPKKCTHIYKFSKKEFDSIFAYYRKAFLQALIEPGEMVGLIAAQSIGEPVTQMTLKSFQKTGFGKSVTLGLPRFEEILSVTQNIKTPMCTIAIDPKFNTDLAIVRKIAANIRYTKFRDLIINASIIYDPNPNKKSSYMHQDGTTNIYEYDNIKSGCHSDIESLPWILRIRLSRERMLERKVTLHDIQTNFCVNWTSKFDDSKSLKKDIKYRKVMEKITKVGITSNYDNSEVPIVHIRFNANYYDWNDLIKFQDYIIEKFNIKGITNIVESDILSQPYIVYDDEGNEIQKERYIIETEGINNKELAQIHGIDMSNTVCNDIVSYYHRYGIEAYRHALILEFKKTIEEGGASTNYQHVELLANNMCHLGSPLAVNRHGANRLDTDVLARATFEEPTDHLISAAVFNQIDYVRNFSSKIVVGELINGGTGVLDVLLDHNKIASYKPNAEKKEVSRKKVSKAGEIAKSKKK